MRIFKRLSLNISSRFSRFVDEVENHAAVVDNAITEARDHARNARLHLARIKRDAAKLSERIEELKTAEAAWQSRALSIQATDREKALACLSRRNKARAERERLEAEYAKTAPLAERIQRDVSKIRDRIEELKRRRNELSARESRARTLGNVDLPDYGSLEHVEDVFDRWESRINDADIVLDEDTDPLEAEFAETEERDGLEAELAALMVESASEPVAGAAEAASVEAPACRADQPTAPAQTLNT